MKLTDTMVLALMKKGMEVHGENMEMDMDINIPGYNDVMGKAKVTVKVGSYTLKINDGSGNEF